MEPSDQFEDRVVVLTMQPRYGDASHLLASNHQAHQLNYWGLLGVGNKGDFSSIRQLRCDSASQLPEFQSSSSPTQPDPTPDNSRAVHKERLPSYSNP